MGTPRRGLSARAPLAAAPLALALAAGLAGAVEPGAKHALDPARTGLPYESIAFPSTGDSVRLAGWWFEGRAGSPVVVCCPRGRGTMADLLPSVRELARRGFTVMTFDLRDFGPGSPGTVDSLRYAVFATRWVDDAQGAFRFARARAAGRFVFGWGQDIGGPLALAVGARDRRLVDALAVEGLFRTAQEQIRYNGSSQLPDVEKLNRRLVTGAEEPISSVPVLSVPLLVVLALKDKVTPPEVTREVTRRSLTLIERWEIPEVGHDGAELTPGYFDHLAEWFRMVAAALPPPAAR